MTESGRGNLLTVHAAPRRPGGAGQAVAGIGTDGTGSRGAWEAVQGLRRMPQGEPSHDSTLLCYHVSCRPGGSLRPLVIHWRRAGGAVAGVLSPVDRHAVGIFVGDCRRRWYRWSRHRGHVFGIFAGGAGGAAGTVAGYLLDTSGAPLILSGCAQDTAGTVADAVKMCRSCAEDAAQVPQMAPGAAAGYVPVILPQVERPHFARPVICPCLSQYRFPLSSLIPSGYRPRIRPV